MQESESAAGMRTGVTHARALPQTVAAPQGVTIERAEQLIRAEMEKHGLFGRGWSYAIERRRSRFGVADFAKQELRFSAPCIAVNPEAELLDTIWHEIAHVLAGLKAGHGLLWKIQARALGARPETCCGKNVVAPDMKYHAICPKCGHRHTRERLPTSRDRRTKERKPYSASCGWCVKKYGGTRRIFEECRLSWVETSTGRAVEWPPKPAAAAAVEQLPAREPETWTVKPITSAVQVSLF